MLKSKKSFEVFDSSIKFLNSKFQKVFGPKKSFKNLDAYLESYDCFSNREQSLNLINELSEISSTENLFKIFVLLDDLKDLNSIFYAGYFNCKNYDLQVLNDEDQLLGDGWKKDYYRNQLKMKSKKGYFLIKFETQFSSLSCVLYILKTIFEREDYFNVISMPDALDRINRTINEAKASKVLTLKFIKKSPASFCIDKLPVPLGSKLFFRDLEIFEQPLKRDFFIYRSLKPFVPKKVLKSKSMKGVSIN